MYFIIYTLYMFVTKVFEYMTLLRYKQNLIMPLVFLADVLQAGEENQPVLYYTLIASPFLSGRVLSNRLCKQLCQGQMHVQRILFYFCSVLQLLQELFFWLLISTLLQLAIDLLHYLMLYNLFFVVHFNLQVRMFKKLACGVD